MYARRMRAIQGNTASFGARTVSTGTILLVEDSDDDRTLAIRALKKNNIANQVVCAKDGVEALDWLFGEGEFADRDTTDRPTVVLLDLNLPRLSGHDVLERIRADSRTRSVPVVILTSSNQEEDLVKSWDRGANSYIRKPIDFNEFSEVVRQLGVYWLLLNQLPRN
jgi:CheY-like chemotaxis protein